jgi:hypothetical protein
MVKNSTNINKTYNRLSPLSPGLEQRLGTLFLPFGFLAPKDM